MGQFWFGTSRFAPGQQEREQKWGHIHHIFRAPKLIMRIHGIYHFPWTRPDHVGLPLWVKSAGGYVRIRRILLAVGLQVHEGYYEGGFFGCTEPPEFQRRELFTWEKDSWGGL